MGAKAPWRVRHDGFEALLESSMITWQREAGGQGWFACVHDLDALDPDTGACFGNTLAPSPLQDAAAAEVWDDAAFTAQRRETLHTLLEAIRRGGWLVLRPAPAAPITRQLAAAASDAAEDDDLPLALSRLVPAADAARLQRAIRGLAPTLRPLSIGLLRLGAAAPRGLARLLEACDASRAAVVVLEAAYDALPVRARMAARRLAVLRGAQPLNGSAGPFHLVSGEPEQEQLRRESLRELVDYGWLHKTGDTFSMSTVVRLFLSQRATLAEPGQIAEDHRWLAGRRRFETLGLRDKLEVHHHAIAGGDPERAKATAVCYGTDLRMLAIRASLAGRYREAAELYQTIVTYYDSEDAYAWEYLGYNLARAQRGRTMAAERLEEIEQALGRACELAPLNPLYRGRLVGFRATRGEPIKPEVDRWMARFQAGGEDAAVGYFAEPVLSGLLRNGSRQELQQVVRDWRHLLERTGRCDRFLKAEP